MFVGKARGPPLSGALERSFTWVGSDLAPQALDLSYRSQPCLTGPSLAHKHWTKLERLNRDKHSCLYQKSVNYGRNKFYSTGLWT